MVTPGRQFGPSWEELIPGYDHPGVMSGRALETPDVSSAERDDTALCVVNLASVHGQVGGPLDERAASYFDLKNLGRGL